MSSEDDKFWADAAGKLRKEKGLCPPTPEEAEAAFDEAPEIPLTDDQIDSIVESVTEGEVTPWEPAPDPDWEDRPAAGEIGEQVLAVFRNQGGEDPEGDRALYDSAPADRRAVVNAALARVSDVEAKIRDKRKWLDEARSCLESTQPQAGTESARLTAERIPREIAALQEELAAARKGLAAAEAEMLKP